MNKTIYSFLFLVLAIALLFFIKIDRPQENLTANIAQEQKGGDTQDIHSLDFDKTETVANKSGYELLLGIRKYDVKAAYILMDKENKEWVYDVLQVDNRFYDSPTERIVKTDDGDYLVVRKLYTKGTGMLQYNDIWYSIDFSFNKVLEYPADGHNFISPERNGLELTSSAQIAKEGDIRVDYTFKSYSQDAYDQLVSTTHKKALFKWNTDKKEYLLDGAKSEITEEELSDILNFNQYLPSFYRF